MVASSFIKIFSITVLVTLLASSVEPATKCPPPLDSSSATEKPERFIVMLSNEKDANTHLQMMNDCYQKKSQHIKETNGGQNILSLSKDNLAVFSTDGLFGYSAFLKPSLVNAIKKMNGVHLVEKDAKVSIKYAIPQNLTRRAVDNNPLKNLDRIDQAKRPLDGKFFFPDSAGKGVNIFVVDTGIRTTHTQFGGRAKAGGAFCDGCENSDDQNGHGTQVASVAAGKTFGVARQANLIAVRVLGADGSGSNVGVINGLSFVLDQHNKGQNKNSVASMSLGGSFSQAVNDAVAKLTTAGVHVAVAAGNDGADACNSSPSSEPSAVTVGATDEDSEQIADFSNIGKCVTTFAPGSNIKGAGNKNDNDVLIFSGTSQATPHVSGTLALLIAKSGNKAPAALKKDLINLSTKGVVQGIGNTGSPDSFIRTPAP